MKFKFLSELEKTVKSEGSIFLGSGMLTAFRLISGLIILKLVAVIGGVSGVAFFGQAQNAAAMFNGILASGAGDGVV